MSEASDYIAACRRRDRRWDVISNAAKLIGTLGICAGLLAYEINGCETSGPTAFEAIHSAGMTDAKLGGPHWGGCADSETSRFFTARNATGQPVAGTVCCGAIVKGCTIRW